MDPVHLPDIVLGIQLAPDNDNVNQMIIPDGTGIISYRRHWLANLKILPFHLINNRC